MKYLNKVSDGITYITDTPRRLYLKLPVVRTIERHKREKNQYKEAADKLLAVVLEQVEDINFRNASWGSMVSDIKRHLTHEGNTLVSRAGINQYIGPPAGWCGVDDHWDHMDDWDPWENPTVGLARPKPKHLEETYGPAMVQEMNN